MTDLRDRWQHVFARLEGVRPANAHGTHKAKCPAHPDNLPSLIIWEGKKGNLLARCLAGCQTQEVLNCLGLEMKMLFADWSADGTTPLPAKPQRVEVCRYDYSDEHGEVCHTTVRYQPKDFRQCRPHPSGGLLWSLNGNWTVRVGGEWRVARRKDPGAVWVEPARLQLYRLPDLLDRWERSPRAVCLVVDGEKDAETAWGLGVMATTTTCGGSRPWHRNYNPHVRGRTFCIIPDFNEAGFDQAARVAGRLQQAGCERVATLKGFTSELCTDLTDWVELRRTRGLAEADIAQELRRLVRAASYYRS